LFKGDEEEEDGFEVRSKVIVGSEDDMEELGM
jgi:hypothetical protein